MSFDQKYYQRFYLNPRTAVTSRAEMRARARLIVGAVDYVGLPVRNILDAGCGIGMLRAPLLRAWPRASYTGVEYSEYLCQRYGWKQGSVATLRMRERFELVICYDVLQYLDVSAARQAIANLARLCRGALYFGVLTSEDWEHNCDQSRTDAIDKLRSAAWYRRELKRWFRPLGMGLWLHRDLDLPMWELDTAGP
ncbi:MAG: class I SAM-dependent methyltransferase [Steroidobacteraceae bacterium]